MNVVSKANALCAAWSGIESAPPITKAAVRLCLAQATFETHCGDDWPLSCNWGAAQYRACTVQELQQVSTGALKNGDWLFADGSHSSTHAPSAVAQLHTDTHPTPSGPQRYAVWFSAFPDDIAGAGNLLHIVLRMASEALGDPNCTVVEYVTAVYRHGYFEGSHAGARPIGKRVAPLTGPEADNVADYAMGLNGVLASIDEALTDWDVTASAAAPAQPELVVPDPTPDDAPPDVA